MEYESTIEDNCSIIALTGEIDLQSSPPAREQMLNALKEKHHLLVDMATVEYIDSSGIASLVEGFQYAKTHNLTFGLVNISHATRQVLELARLDQIFILFESLDKGLAVIKE